MRVLGTLPSLRTARNPLVAFGLFVVVIFAAYKAAGAIIADDLNSLVLAALLFVAGGVVIAILNDWRRGFYGLVAWILFEDLVRKYLGNNMAIFFGKDVLAIVLYISFFRALRAKKFETLRVPFRIPLLLFLWFALLQVFNPASTSIFYGILGMKIYFLYVPLIYIGYALMKSEKDLRRFFSFVCALILIVAALGLAQSIIGPTFLNPVTLQEDLRELGTLYRTAPISGQVAYRPTSVFVSAGRFQDFLIVAWLISLSFSGYLLLRSRRGRTLAFTTVGVVAAASLMSASRGVFMWTIGDALVISVGFLWGAPWRQGEVLRVLRTIQRTTLIVGIGIILLLTMFPKELGSRVAIYSETLMPDSPASELVHRTQTYPLKQLEYAFDHPRWPYGYGMGTCSLGRQYVMRIMHAAPMYIGVENGYGNLVVQLGIVGLVLWIVLGFSIAISAWKVVKELRGTPLFPLSFAIWFYAILLFFPMMFVGTTPYEDFFLNSWLWLLLGIHYRLRKFSTATQIPPGQANP
jgi:O-antigen ligase